MKKNIEISRKAIKEKDTNLTELTMVPLIPALLSALLRTLSRTLVISIYQNYH